MSRARGRRLAAGALALCLATAVGDWLLLRTRAISHPTWLLALPVGAALLLLVLQAGLALGDLARRRGSRARSVARLLAAGGAGLALGAGLLNWALSLQGFVILHEGEAVPLHGGSHLQHLEGGPLSRIEEMDLVLVLAEVELVPDGRGGLFPRSLLEVQRPGSAPERLGLDPRSAAAHGSLRFHQGTFGYAPRLVIQRRGETLLDRVVPLTTERRGPGSVSFQETFTLDEERLRVEAAVDLASLDAGLRGHATLRLALYEDDRLLGRGELLPGYFAEIEGGYRVGFAGLVKWSEIDVSRRSYGRFVLLGALLLVAGAVVWPLAGRTR